MQVVVAVAVGSLSWFILAALLFFNPVVDPFYRSAEGHPAVRALPPGPSTIARILVAVIVQVALWAVVFRQVSPALPAALWPRGLAFAGIVAAMKIVPRDIDRVLLTTYPTRRLVIELVIGVVCGVPVGLTFAWFL